MEQNNNNNFEQILKNYYKEQKNIEIPEEINTAFDEALNKINNKQHLSQKLSKVAIVIFSIGILGTSVVFAKDIINFITSLFNNSTEAIDTATENGYIQNIDMDYIYSNDIGIKIDNIIMDTTNLDISYVYKIENNKEISSIELNDYSIKDENKNLIYKSNFEDINNLMFTTTYIKYNPPILLDNNIFKDSILYKSKDFPISKKLFFEISSLKIKINDDEYILNGLWNFEIPIETQFQERNNITYEVLSNEYINNSTVELTETSLKIELYFNTKLGEHILESENNITLEDIVKKLYTYKTLNLDTYYINSKPMSKLNIEYDISKYNNNLDNLTLRILDLENDISIILKKIDY